MKTTGLTIQEAIKSKLPHKLPEHTGWISHANVYSKSDILREDWQIKVPEVTITRENLAEAWDNLVKKHEYVSRYTVESKDSVLFEALCKELWL